jgi:uncharacterized membrane protein YoaK (UPF0700 family)
VEANPVRSGERDMLLVLLAVSAGSADGWSYFGLGHAFVANMTGNTVLLGLAVFQKGGDLVHPLISLVCYLAGATAASLITRSVRQGVVWWRAITLALFLEAAIMAGSEVAWITIHRAGAGASTQAHLSVLLGCVAFAIGLQSGAMLQLRIPGAVTTYITGTWTNLVNGLIRLAGGERQKTRPGRPPLEERMWMHAGILAAYFLAAVLTGWFFRYAPMAVGALSAASVWIVAVYAAIRAGREPAAL